MRVGQPSQLRCRADGAHYIYMGAEGRYEDYIFLQMLEREWGRPVAEFDRLTHAEAPSARSALVLLFWSYFETRVERLHRSAMRGFPLAVQDKLLKRHGSVGNQLHELYRKRFRATYFDDLRSLGFAEVAELLIDLHDRRNQFVHGHPQSITDETVLALVVSLKAQHEAWIAVYNHRAARPPDGQARAP